MSVFVLLRFIAVVYYYYFLKTMTAVRIARACYVCMEARRIDQNRREHVWSAYRVPADNRPRLRWRRVRAALQSLPHGRNSAKIVCTPNAMSARENSGRRRRDVIVAATFNSGSDGGVVCSQSTDPTLAPPVHHRRRRRRVDRFSRAQPRALRKHRPDVAVRRGALQARFDRSERRVHNILYPDPLCRGHCRARRPFNTCSGPDDTRCTLYGRVTWVESRNRDLPRRPSVRPLRPAGTRERATKNPIRRPSPPRTSDERPRATDGRRGLRVLRDVL